MSRASRSWNGETWLLSTALKVTVQQANLSGKSGLRIGEIVRTHLSLCVLRILCSKAEAHTAKLRSDSLLRHQNVQWRSASVTVT